MTIHYTVFNFYYKYPWSYSSYTKEYNLNYSFKVNQPRIFINLVELCYDLVGREGFEPSLDGFSYYSISL